MGGGSNDSFPGMGLAGAGALPAVLGVGGVEGFSGGGGGLGSSDGGSLYEDSACRWFVGSVY